MQGEKATATLEPRLRELIAVLKKSPFLQDAELPQPVIGVLWEISENLNQVSYYAEDWRKSGYLKKKHKGSAMRHKIQQLTLSIVNLTHLMDTVSQMGCFATRTIDMGSPFEL